MSLTFCEFLAVSNSSNLQNAYIFTIRLWIYRDTHFLVYHIMYPLMQLAHLTEHNEKCMTTRKLFSTNDTILYSLPLTIEAFGTLLFLDKLTIETRQELC